VRHADVVRFLLDHGIDVNAVLRLYGEGHSALHLAAYHAHTDIVTLLVARGAALDVTDRTWGTAPLTWALTGWLEGNDAPEQYYEAVATLVRAGATVRPEWLNDASVRSDVRMIDALRADRRRDE
jgi:ankyrin repeat protein